MNWSFRCPGRPRRLAALLSRAVDEPPGRLLASGRVEIAGQVVRDPDHPVPAGALVEVASTSVPASAPEASGVWVAWVAPAPAWPGGRLRVAGGEVVFEVLARRAGAAQVRAEGQGASVCEALAAAGAPVVGDARHGGVLLAGGLRLAPSGEGSPGGESDAPDPPFDPDEPLLLGLGEGEPPVLHVSRATARALERGHPWLVPDDEMDDPKRFAPGALVAVQAPGHGDLGLARIEADGRVAGRRWSRSRGAGPSLEARVARALERRRSLLEAPPDVPATDAFRLVHGEADALPGLVVDRLGPLLRVLVSGRAAEGLVEPVLAAIGDGRPVVRVLHLRDRPAGELVCAWLEGELPARDERGRVEVWERGLAFGIEPGLERPDRPTPGVGLFLDQRENRERLAARAARGGRWLNLFAHTGAFSVALLAAGAEAVTSVDLSAPYLRWLESNLARNGLGDARHRSVRRDGRRFFEELAEREGGARFDGILIDPPTAAAAGRRFWQVGRDLPPLLERAFAHLAPDGVLFVARNDRRRRGLAELVARAADAAGVALADVQDAPAGPDFPSLPGFPEGDPFSAVLATVAGRRQRDTRRRRAKGRGRRRV